MNLEWERSAIVYCSMFAQRMEGNFKGTRYQSETAKSWTCFRVMCREAGKILEKTKEILVGEKRGNLTCIGLSMMESKDGPIRK